MHEVYFNIPLGVEPTSNSFLWLAKSCLGLMSSCHLPPLRDIASLFFMARRVKRVGGIQNQLKLKLP